jgi:peptide/nickel transport system permease protein
MSEASQPTAGSAAVVTPPASPRRDLLRRFFRQTLSVVGLAIVVTVVVLALSAPLLSVRDPQEMFVIDRLQPPSATYLFGTDHFGRDLYARVVYGAQLSLRVATIVVVLTTSFGLLIGALTGFFKAVDNVLMRLMDAMMSFPSILLAIAIMSVLGRSEVNAIIALTIVYTPNMARLVRAQVLATRSLDYVEAVRALGGGEPRILARHVLPAIWSPVIVQATFVAVYAILAEAGLSFLGAGTPPSIPSWGNILAEGRQYMIDAPWIMLFPGLAISITVLGLNLLGDGLRDLFDPRLQGRG